MPLWSGSSNSSGPTAGGRRRLPRAVRPSAVWVTGGGRRLIGLDAISEFTRTVLPGAMSNGSVTYQVEHVLFISPDVALTGVRQQYVDLDGNPTAAGLPSYIWRRADGIWRNIAGQNTGAADADSR